MKKRHMMWKLGLVYFVYITQDLIYLESNTQWNAASVVLCNYGFYYYCQG